MGKIKKKLRAQRKFAQGAFIPPQNNPSTSASAAITHASHRAVNAPGLVIHNTCTVKDILTRMSLGRAHPHDNWQPVVRLEYDCGSATKPPDTTQKRKIKNKKKHKANHLKKKYALQNRKKSLSSDLANTRRVSISDSGEDTPLSYFTSREDTKSVLPHKSPKKSPKPTRTLPVPTRTPPMPARTSPVPARTSPVPACTLPVLSQKLALTPVHTSPVPARTYPVPARTSPVPARTSPVPARTSPVPARTSPVPARTSPVPARTSPVPARTSPAPPQAPPAPVVMNTRKRQIKPYIQDTFVYGAFSETASVENYNNAESDDPDYELSSSCSSIASSEFTIKRKRKRKLAINKGCNYAKKLKTRGFSTTSGMDPIPTIEPFAKTAQWINSHHQARLLSTDIGDSGILNTPDSLKMISSANTRLTAAGRIIYTTPGIISLHPSGSSRLTAPGKNRLPAPTVPESLDTTALASSEFSYLESRSRVAKETSTPVQAAGDDGHFKLPYLPSRVAKETSTPVQAAGDDGHFKLPFLPVFRTKHNKSNNCPARLLNDLQELLNSQPDKNNPNCNACKRCELLSKYRKVVIKLPVSDANEPDILETTPRDVYDFDSDDEGFKFLRRGRELVRNVLTTKRFPIWLSNLAMNLKKTMFQDEHKLGTLKRTIVFEKNDVSDATVSKVISRIDYLNQCIIEDKKELDAEKSRRRLRSAKRACLPVCRRLPQMRGRPRRKRAPTTPNQPIHTEEDHTPPDTEVEPEPPAETPSTPPRQASPNERHLILCLTPLEEMVEQGRTPPAVNATQPNGGKTKFLRSLNMNPTPKETLPLAQLLSVEQTSITQPVNNTFDKSALYDFPNLADDEGFIAESNCKKHQPIRLTETKQQTLPSPTQTIDEELVYRPTPEEFKDPIVYIGKIQEKASKYGICKIIPPKGFDVPCHLDDNSMFTTINQYLGRLYQRWGPTSRQLTNIQSYVAMLANSRERDQFTKAPMIDGVELDLVKLYHIVLEHGGIEELLAHSEKWARIAEQMCLVSPRGKPDHKKLEKLYCKHVLPYESLSDHDRQSIQCMVDRVWSERSKTAFKRAKRPLHYQKRMLGESESDDDDDDEPPLEPVTSDVRPIGKQCFDKTEECTGKGRTMNLATYRRIASQIQTMRFANGPTPTAQEVEDDYWGILTFGNEHVSVLSAFIDTSVDSLGHTSDPAGPGGSHPWNLKRLSENPRNILSSLGKTLSLTVPTLCLNQVFSTNCWHMDPHKLAWMDYMHEGTTKIWYAVSEHDADDFRRAMEFLAPAAVQNKGIWLASDTTMVPPALLMANGVKLQRLEQNPGEFIVVFPGAYASSIATGLTISESIYFENKFWLNNIDRIFQQMRVDCEPAMFSNTLLLLRMARDPQVSVDVMPQVHLSVRALIEDELGARKEAIKFKCVVTLDQSGRPDRERTPISWPHQDECSICRAPLILSKTVRYNDHRYLMCLKHGLQVYSVAPEEERGPCGPPVTLLYSNLELQAITCATEHRMLDAAHQHYR